MLQTKIKYELKKGKNSKLSQVRVNVHEPTIFHNHSKYSFGDDPDKIQV